MKKIIILFTLFISIPVFSLPFNSLLSQKEKDDLLNGQVLIRNIDKYKNMCIEGSNPGIQKLREIVDEQNPNYLAEVIQVKPYEGNENLQEVHWKIFLIMQEFLIGQNVISVIGIYILLQ